MKICILTQPLHTNYGGLLQAYALQVVLKELGHHVLTADMPKKPSHYKDLRYAASRIYHKYIRGNKAIKSLLPERPSKREYDIIAQHTKEFIRNHISTTEKLSVSKRNKLINQGFDAYIVGSDQVWRPKYSPGITAYFLDFLKFENKVKRISYAASFGVDEWEYDDQSTLKCKKLIQKFDAVSVRELSGIDLCRRYFEVDAVQMPDPTLLLDATHYHSLINYKQSKTSTKNLIKYILDETEEKKLIINNIEMYLGMEAVSAMPKSRYKRNNDVDLPNCIYPPVEDWLSGFANASFVVTDSFHGCIFSIIFKKNFIAIGNTRRGLSRFRSLLNKFGLQERLILDPSDLTTKLLESSIDFDMVYLQLSDEKSKAKNFLIQYLESNQQ